MALERQETRATIVFHLRFSDYSLRINAQHVTQAIDVYIDYKVSLLEALKAHPVLPGQSARENTPQSGWHLLVDSSHCTATGSSSKLEHFRFFQFKCRLACAFF
jgi:hypothetical protein